MAIETKPKAVMDTKRYVVIETKYIKVALEFWISNPKFLLVQSVKLQQTTYSGIRKGYLLE